MLYISDVHHDATQHIVNPDLCLCQGWDAFDDSLRQTPSVQAAAGNVAVDNMHEAQVDKLFQDADRDRDGRCSTKLTVHACSFLENHVYLTCVVSLKVKSKHTGCILSLTASQSISLQSSSTSWGSV